MKANVVVFPGARIPAVELPGETATVREVLAAAGVPEPTAGEPVALAVNGDVVTDMNAIVADGAYVVKTSKIEGA